VPADPATIGGVRQLCFLLALCACSASGQYATTDRQGGMVDRGDTNGRTFDFVSNKPEGDDWTIRIRGSSMWISYANEETIDDLGTVNLTDKEARKVWDLIDTLDIESRKVGKKDEDEGYVQLRIVDPDGGDDDGPLRRTIFISRTTEDDDVLALATYLQALIAKYKQESPNF
jgi:hypothetical protein